MQVLKAHLEVSLNTNLTLSALSFETVFPSRARFGPFFFFFFPRWSFQLEIKQLLYTLEWMSIPSWCASLTGKVEQGSFPLNRNQPLKAHEPPSRWNNKHSAVGLFFFFFFFLNSSATDFPQLSFPLRLFISLRSAVCIDIPSFQPEFLRQAVLDIAVSLLTGS